MFDYEAGEKYKLTLIMVGVAGLIAGIFFATLLAPTPESPATRRRQLPAHATHPDVTGYAPPPADMAYPPQPAGPAGAEPMQAKMFVESLLPLLWDLNAASAHQSQAQAMSHMTPECAGKYQQNIWTPQVAQQIQTAGIQSAFTAHEVVVGQTQPDGSVVVTVAGSQTLSVPGKGGKSRPVKLEYLIKQFPEGMKIAGITDLGSS